MVWPTEPWKSQRGDLVFENLLYSFNLFAEASRGDKKLSLGEKLFILGSVRDTLAFDDNNRMGDVNELLFELISAGVYDYKNIPKGKDSLVDAFYEEPQRYHPEVFRRM